MTERTFTYGDLTVTVHRQRIKDRLAVTTIVGRMSTLGLGDAYTQLVFGRCLAQSTVSGMPWATSQSSDAELAAVFDAWGELDADVFELWNDALDLVDMKLNGAALAVEKKE